MTMVYDLIIVGGGLVGTGLAAALRTSGLRIALVDARVPDCNDPRLFALNAASCQFLKNLGLWERIAPHAAPIHQVHVSWQGHFGAVRLNREDARLPALGYVIPAYVIETTLNADAANYVTLYRPARLRAVSQQDNVAHLTLEADGRDIQISAPLVIGADGTDSTMRQLLHIQTDVHDYRQSALVTRTSLRRAHDHIAYERFTRNGAIAMLPLADAETDFTSPLVGEVDTLSVAGEGKSHQCATIWTADSESIARLMSLSDEAFVQELQREFGYRLGRLLRVHKRHVYPLRMVRAKESVDQCVFLLGNSAHTLHPIAAQGLNLALYEVASLVDGIMANISQNKPLSAHSLRQISQKIEKQQAKSIGVSHRLSSLFSTDSVCMGLALQAGLTGFDLAAPLKTRFIREMLGTTGSVPGLLIRHEALQVNNLD